MLKRRSVLTAAAALAAPRIARGQPARVLKMVPQANLASLDPIWTAAGVTRNHGYMVHDTLYGRAWPKAEAQLVGFGERAADIDVGASIGRFRPDPVTRPPRK